MAGAALTASTATQKASAAAGRATATRAAHRQVPVSAALSAAATRPRTGRRRGKRAAGVPAALSTVVTGGVAPDPSMRGSLDRLDLLVGLGDHLARQRAESHLAQVCGAVAVLGVDGPLQEGAYRPGLRRAGLLLVHDGVLVVDDRVAVLDPPVDHRDRACGRGLLGEP